MIGKPYYIINSNVCDILSDNENAIPILEQYPEKISWDYLSSNKNAIPMLEKNLDKINWYWLSNNKNAIHLIEKQIQGINWVYEYYRIFKHKKQFIFSHSNRNELINNLKKISKCSLIASNYVYVGINLVIYILNRIYKYNLPSYSIRQLIHAYCIAVSTNVIYSIGKYIYDYITDVYYVNWNLLSSNPHAISLLEKNIKKINWKYLSRNPNAISILEKYPEKIEWDELSENPNAIPILEKNIDKVNWYILSENPNAIHILEKNLDKIHWYWLSINPNAIHILEKYPEKIEWDELSENPNAIHLLEKNLDKINWYWLSCNPNAIHILEKNLDKIDWYQLSMNPNANHLITTLDKEKMKENMKHFHEELVKYVFNPDRLIKLANHLDITFDQLNELY